MILSKQTNMRKELLQAGSHVETGEVAEGRKEVIIGGSALQFPGGVKMVLRDLLLPQTHASDGE